MTDLSMVTVTATDMGTGVKFKFSNLPMGISNSVTTYKEQFVDYVNRFAEDGWDWQAWQLDRNDPSKGFYSITCMRMLDAANEILIPYNVRDEATGGCPLYTDGKTRRMLFRFFDDYMIFTWTAPVKPFTYYKVGDATNPQPAPTTTLKKKRKITGRRSY